MRRFSGMLWPVLLLALLGVLAWLQFRWTGQISASERERMQSSLRSSVRRFAGDVDDEAGRLFSAFRVADASELGARLERYRSEAHYPELVSTVYASDADGTLSRVEASEPRGLVPVAWPPELASVRDQIVGGPQRATRGWRGGPQRATRGWPPFALPVFSGDPSVIAIPIVASDTPREARRSGLVVSGYAVVTLDRETLRDVVFPELAERHFGAEYDVAVVDAAHDLVFATDAGEDALAGADAREELFSPGRFMGGPPRRRGERRRPPPELAEARERVRRAREGGWEVFVRHRAGSLEDFVARTRVRNLVVSFGILGLLAASIALVTVSTRRATELNDRKMEFVAGVSHELRTPVAVLRSAGQNLADGSVHDPSQVKRYGTLIESEGRRLNDLVDRVLELAGIQSQKRRYRREPVLVSVLVADALADCEALIKEHGTELTTKLSSERLTALGDADAMRRALGNIINNAVKHGGEDNVVDVVAEERGGKIAIVVTDRGPGIPDNERAHLFEAFYRGRRSHDRQVQGSGLGLSLVDHVAREHGGRVELDSTPGKGSRFTLYLPAGSTS